jgi:Outer membrane protein
VASWWQPSFAAETVDAAKAAPGSAQAAASAKPAASNKTAASAATPAPVVKPQAIVAPKQQATSAVPARTARIAQTPSPASQNPVPDTPSARPDMSTAPSPAPAGNTGSGVNTAGGGAQGTAQSAPGTAQSTGTGTGTSSGGSGASGTDFDTTGLTGDTIPPTDARTGVPADTLSLPPLGIPDSQRKEDYQLINTQAETFRKRFLKGEAIELRIPMPDQLLPLGGHLPPIRLEANYTRPISLADCVEYGLTNNLPIRIQATQAESQRWLLVGALGRFLPDAITNYRSEYLEGGRLVGGILPAQFKTPNVTTSAGVRWFGSQGGRVFFGSLQSLHQYKAAKEQLFGTINDQLLAITRGYYSMVRNEALLEIQTRAVDVSEAQVNLNQQLENAGTGTRFQVLQSETQLARDQQNLLTQEVSLRRAAIDLATVLNLNASVNLLSVETEVRKVRLIDPALTINRLLTLAIDNRPELKQFEHLRIAAKRAIQVAAAPLYPQVQFFGTVTGSGATLTKTYALSQPKFENVTVNTPLQGQVITAPGDPTFAADNSQLGFGNGSATTAGSVLTGGRVFIPPAYVNRQIRRSWDIGFQVDWNFLGMGIPDLGNIGSQRALARQALLNANQQLMTVLQEVRSSYLTSETAERKIEVSTKEVISSAEQLRLSRVRLANGVGTNIDVINAQRDFTTALVNKADAIIAFNIAQAQLLRDIGMISRSTLTSGRWVR